MLCVTHRGRRGRVHCCCSGWASEPGGWPTPRWAPGLLPPRSMSRRPSPARRIAGCDPATGVQRAGRSPGPAAPRRGRFPAGKEVFREFYIPQREWQLSCLLVLFLQRHGSNLVVLGAALILVHSDSLPVQHPVMTFPLSTKHQTLRETKMTLVSQKLTIMAVSLTCRN